MPDRIPRARDMPTTDHHSPAFSELDRSILAGCQPVFHTSSPVVIFASTGTGAREAAHRRAVVIRLPRRAYRTNAGGLCSSPAGMAWYGTAMALSALGLARYIKPLERFPFALEPALALCLRA